MMKIVFFGTSNVGLEVLKVLASSYELLAVVTSPDAPFGRKQILTPSPISKVAAALGVKQLKPEKVKGNLEFFDELKEFNADIFIVVSYGKILPLEVIDLPKLKTLNIHFSLLPAYRGAAPIQAALKNGDVKSGTTIFVLDELLDHGPILAQKEVEIAPDDTFTTLAGKMSSISTEMLLELLPKYASGQVTPTEQDHEKATKAPMIKKVDGKIDWQQQAQEIYNLYRAYNEWPGIFSFWGERLLKVLTCKVTQDISKDLPGTVLPGGRVVCGGGTVLELLSVQLEGKNVVDIKTFLNGNKEFVGTALG